MQQMPYNFSREFLTQILRCFFLNTFAIFYIDITLLAMMFYTPTNKIDQEIFSLIEAGGILIYPTETIYGIGCDALQDKALRRVFEIKRRAPEQPPPVLISDEKQLQKLVARVPQHARILMDEYWPGALTIVLPARDEISALLCGMSRDGTTRTIAVRLTHHKIARSLCGVTPLVATSANFSGAMGREAAPRVLDDIPHEFKNQVDAVVDGGEVGGQPSTIVDCSGDAPRVLRIGAIELKNKD
jgi:L-threonylcarbamoyladenylate synthase